MKNYRERLYDVYVSGGQACRSAADVTGSDTALYQWIARKFMPADKSVSILDLACGNGVMLLMLKKEGYTKIKGVDVSPEQIELAGKTGVDNVECADINEFMKKTNETFDVVCLLNILEHMTKQEVFDTLDLVGKVLKKGGKLVALVPNGAGIFGMFVRYNDFTHESCFTENSLRQVLYAVEFENIKLYEVPPIIHGVKSFVRYVLWNCLSLFQRLLLIVESGILRQQITQSIIVTADKK